MNVIQARFHKNTSMTARISKTSAHTFFIDGTKPEAIYVPMTQYLRYGRKICSKIVPTLQK